MSPPEGQSAESLDGEFHSRRSSFTGRSRPSSIGSTRENHRQENRNRKPEDSVDQGPRLLPTPSALSGPPFKVEWRQQSTSGNTTARLRRDWRSDSTDTAPGLDGTTGGTILCETGIAPQTKQAFSTTAHSTNNSESGTEEKQRHLSLTDQRAKHALEQPWCLFVLQDGEHRTQESWNESQIGVHEFDCVEDFWCMMTHIHPPSHLGVSDYSLFKKGVKPAWEDAAVSQGGRWVARLPLRLRSLDDLWEHVSMGLIGETLHVDHSRSICGAVVSVRPRSLKLSLWLSLRDPEGAKAVGCEFQSIILSHLESKDRKTCELVFQSFKDNIEYRLSPTGVFAPSQHIGHVGTATGPSADGDQNYTSQPAGDDQQATHRDASSPPDISTACSTSDASFLKSSVTQSGPISSVTHSGPKLVGSYDETVRSYLAIRPLEATHLKAVS